MIIIDHLIPDHAQGIEHKAMWERNTRHMQYLSEHKFLNAASSVYYLVLFILRREISDIESSKDRNVNGVLEQTINYPCQD